MNPRSLNDIYDLCNNPGSDYVKYNEDLDVDMASWVENNTLYFSFQHTNSKIDWALNLSTWVQPYSNMTVKFFVHSGFLKAYKSIRNKVFDDIYTSYAESNQEIKKVVIAGYSLGGALAKLCYEDFFWRIENIDSYKNTELEGYAIGAPNVFSVIKNKKEIKRRFKGFYSVANGNDIVTMVPPWWLLFFRDTVDIKIGKRFPALGFALPSAVYHHHWDSYKNKMQNGISKDTKKNNAMYSKAHKIYIAIYAIIILAIIVSLL